MRKLNNIFWLILIYCFVAPGCKQITQSVAETFHPNDSLASKYNKEHHFGKNGEYTGTTESSSTHTTHFNQQKVTVINGDTINTPELQAKAKVFFEDLEKMKQQQTPANSKAIQKRAEQFLKDLRLSRSLGKTNGNKEEAEIPTKRFLNAAELKQAEIKLKQLPQYRNKEIMVFQTIYFGEYGTIKLQLQHPKNPRYIDEYLYENGNWFGPIPVQVASRDVGHRLSPLSKISFANAAKVRQIYDEKALQVEGANPTNSVSIAIWDDDMRWYAGTIKGTRERYRLDFNVDGSLKSFKQE